jgi:hypothetical protein
VYNGLQVNVGAGTMTQITLTPEQAALLASAQGLVALRRPDGSFIGWISPGTKFIIPNECPFTPEEIAAAEKEAECEGPWHTTREVLDHIQALQDDQQ